jgi:hypothetical protein
MIQPTIGRVVWYHPSTGDPDLAKFSQAHEGKPFAAIVAHVWSDTCVNLCVIDPNGQTLGRTSVFLWQGDTDRPSNTYAEWMPYQKGQAARTEELEKERRRFDELKLPDDPAK